MKSACIRGGSVGEMKEWGNMDEECMYDGGQCGRDGGMGEHDV